MDLLKKEFASKLMKVKAIKLQPENPFTWASGWKSPFYCDNRKTLSYLDLRNEITPGNFTFRTREFEQMECEFFCKPGRPVRPTTSPLWISRS